MKKILTYLLILTLILTLFPTIAASVEFHGDNNHISNQDISQENLIYKNYQAEKAETISKERTFQIATNGTTCPMKVIPGTGWFCFFQLIRPWPDQMYFSFFGFINYENGTTTIKDTSTGETVHREGAHKVLFYNFYGPVSSFKSYTVSLQGNALFAMVIGG